MPVIFVAEGTSAEDSVVLVVSADRAVWGDLVARAVLEGATVAVHPVDSRQVAAAVEVVEAVVEEVVAAEAEADPVEEPDVERLAIAMEMPHSSATARAASRIASLDLCFTRSATQR